MAILPSATGGGLTAATGAVLGALREKRALETDERRFLEELGLKKEQISQEDRRLGAMEQAAAFEQLKAVGDMFPGQTIGQNPLLKSRAIAAFGDEFSPDLFDGLVVSEKSTQNILSEIAREAFEAGGLTSEDEAEIVQTTFGLTDPTQRLVDESVLGSQLRGVQAFADTLSGDPVAAADVGRALTGGPDNIEIEIGGQSFRIDQGLAAQLAGDRIKAQLSFRASTGDDRLRFIENFQDRIRSAYSIELTPQAAEQIMDAVADPSGQKAQALFVQMGETGNSQGQLALQTAITGNAMAGGLLTNMLSPEDLANLSALTTISDLNIDQEVKTDVLNAYLKRVGELGGSEIQGGFVSSFPLAQFGIGSTSLVSSEPVEAAPTPEGEVVVEITADGILEGIEAGVFDIETIRNHPNPEIKALVEEVERRLKDGSSGG